MRCTHDVILGETTVFRSMQHMIRASTRCSCVLSWLSNVFGLPWNIVVLYSLYMVSQSLDRVGRRPGWPGGWPGRGQPRVGGRAANWQSGGLFSFYCLAGRPTGGRAANGRATSGRRAGERVDGRAVLHNMVVIEHDRVSPFCFC